MKRVIWIISEGSPGHLSQSLGMAEAVAARVPAIIRQLKCRPRRGGMMRGFIRRFWMGKKARPLPTLILDHWLRLERPAKDDYRPDLIISSGGKSVFAARTLATNYGVALIFLGERKPYPASWFHTTFSPSSFDTAANNVRIDLIPTKISPSIINEAADQWADRPQGRLWAMLIGGSSRSHHYQTDDWENLATGMITLARREGIRWLVSTSRRSGRASEDQLKNLLPPDIVADAVWWYRKQEKKLISYLGAAERLWITQDSVSMVTEAVASGKPTVVVYPTDVRFPPTSFMLGYFANLEKIGLIQRSPMSHLPELELTPASHSIRTILTTDGLAKIACQRLGWESAHEIFPVIGPRM